MAPWSLARRLSVAAAAQVIVATIVAGLLIGIVLHRFVQGQIDQRLDTHIGFLASALRVSPDGRPQLAGDANGPPFDRPGRGWYWQIALPGAVLRSTSLEGDALEANPKAPPRPPPDGRDRPRPADGPGPDGKALHFRVQTIESAAGPAVITASAPRQAVWAPLRETLLLTALPLIVVMLLAIGASVALVRIGLRPLTGLLRDLVGVRRGDQPRLPDRNPPAEIAPIAHEVNALLSQNEETLERARRHVANLAHGLKTPLATLAIAWSDQGRAKTIDGHALIVSMEQRIRHHLGRARIAAIAGPARTRVSVSESLEGLLGALARVFADRAISTHMDVPADLAVSCDQQDFDEIAGNILENAFKAARSRITVHAIQTSDGFARLRIKDDGPGIAEDHMAAAMQVGQRLDETTPGFGFGLPIARELVELSGGTLIIGRSAELGGARVDITLPVASVARSASS